MKEMQEKLAYSTICDIRNQLTFIIVTGFSNMFLLLAIIVMFFDKH